MKAAHSAFVFALAFARSWKHDFVFQTLALYFDSIPEPTFVQDFLDGTCCCVLVLYCFVSLNWAHIVQAKSKPSDSVEAASLSRFTF